MSDHLFCSCGRWVREADSWRCTGIGYRPGTAISGTTYKVLYCERCKDFLRFNGTIVRSNILERWAESK